MQHANLPLQKTARKNVIHARMYVFIRPFAICMHGCSASVAKGPSSIRRQHPVSSWPVRFYRQRFSRVFPLSNLRFCVTHKGDDFRFSHMRNFIIFSGESEIREPKPVVGFYVYVTRAILLSGPVSLSGDNIMTSRSRYWFFISISKPFLAVIGTPLGVDTSVNPSTR